jgi:hypothetical protein
MKWTSWVTAGVLLGLIGFVVWSSLRVGHVRCEVCMDFGGRQACRAVDADSEGDARMGAITNACAFLSSGVTDTMACQRTPPTKADCHS